MQVIAKTNIKNKLSYINKGRFFLSPQYFSIIKGNDTKDAKIKIFIPITGNILSVSENKKKIKR